MDLWGPGNVCVCVCVYLELRSVRRQFRLHEVVRWDPNLVQLGTYGKRKRHRALCAQRKGHVRTQGEGGRL